MFPTEPKQIIQSLFDCFQWQKAQLPSTQLLHKTALVMPCTSSPAWSSKWRLTAIDLGFDQPEKDVPFSNSHEYAI